MTKLKKHQIKLTLEHSSSQSLCSRRLMICVTHGLLLCNYHFMSATFLLSSLCSLLLKIMNFFTHFSRLKEIQSCKVEPLLMSNIVNLVEGIILWLQGTPSSSSSPFTIYLVQETIKMYNNSGADNECSTGALLNVSSLTWIT